MQFAKRLIGRTGGVVENVIDPVDPAFIEEVLGQNGDGNRCIRNALFVAPRRHDNLFYGGLLRPFGESATSRDKRHGD